MKNYSIPQNKASSSLYNSEAILYTSMFLVSVCYFFGSAIIFLMFRNFLMFDQVSFSPQKRSVIISNKLVYTSCLTSCRKN